VINSFHAVITCAAVLGCDILSCDQLAGSTVQMFAKIRRLVLELTQEILTRRCGRGLGMILSVSWGSAVATQDSSMISGSKTNSRRSEVPNRPPKYYFHPLCSSYSQTHSQVCPLSPIPKLHTAHRDLSRSRAHSCSNRAVLGCQLILGEVPLTTTLSSAQQGPIQSC